MENVSGNLVARKIGGQYSEHYLHLRPLSIDLDLCFHRSISAFTFPTPETEPQLVRSG